MQIQISFEIRKKSNLYLMKIQISFDFKKSFDSHQQILKFKKKNYNKQSSKEHVEENSSKVSKHGNHILKTRHNKAY